MMRLLLLLVSLLGNMAAGAQPASGSHWYTGLKLGTGTSDIWSALPGRTYTAFTGGLSRGYTTPVPGGAFSVQLDALLEQRPALSWQAADASSTVLFVPLCVRTAGPAARVHVLLGAGPSVWISDIQVPARWRDYYTTHRLEATLTAGVEVRLLPLRRHETTLQLAARRGVTPTLTRHLQSPGGSRYDEQELASWLGATLNVYFHPAARP